MRLISGRFTGEFTEMIFTGKYSKGGESEMEKKVVFI